MHHTAVAHAVLHTLLYGAVVIVLLNIFLVATGLGIHLVGRRRRKAKSLAPRLPDESLSTSKK